MGLMRPSLLQDKLIDLLLILTGFVAAIVPYSALLKSGLNFKEMLFASVIAALAFWVAIQFHDAGSEGFVIGLLERFCLGAGANLLLHALLAYGFFVRRIPFLIAIGSLVAAVLLSLRRYRVSRRSEMDSRVLLIGFDAITRKIAASLRQPVLGVIGPDISSDVSDGTPSLPERVPFLGSLAACEKIIRDQRPTHVVIGMNDWDSRISPSVLLNCRLAGTVVEDAPAVYERIFHRVSCQRLQPMDLLLSSSLRGDSRTMAIQAIYTNLIGLSFLVALSPILMLVAFAIALSSRGGPVFESTDCAGFRYIPFQRLRFRTLRTDGSGQMTRLGRAITRLHLANLPQLINVVRGEMALVGPRAVRQDFAHYLTGLMPFYSHRFSVKPGIMGWAQLHLSARGLPSDECLQAEYDLYYIKEGSPWLDGQILLDSLLRGGAGLSVDSGGASLNPC
jgi:lipopolysaccharide/colanic/teichoic acid biosynthesis glycosyltransferase